VLAAFEVVSWGRCNAKCEAGTGEARKVQGYRLTEEYRGGLYEIDLEMAGALARLVASVFVSEI